MKGTLYGVGVGPGDAELMTLKAVRVIRACDVVAVPHTGEADRVALDIALQAVPELAEKPLLELEMPMTRDQQMLDKFHDAAADEVMELLEVGKNVAFLTLGDPTVYSTYSYVHKRVVSRGGNTEIVPGVPSFCAVAAALNTSLSEGKQALHIIPASYEGADSGLNAAGTKVLMKTGKSLPKMKALLKEKGLLQHARMVQKCGMPGQVVIDDMASADADASYFSIIVVKDGEQ